MPAGGRLFVTRDCRAPFAHRRANTTRAERAAVRRAIRYAPRHQRRTNENTASLYLLWLSAARSFLDEHADSRARDGKTPVPKSVSLARLGRSTLTRPAT